MIQEEVKQSKNKKTVRKVRQPKHRRQLSVWKRYGIDIFFIVLSIIALLCLVDIFAWFVPTTITKESSTPFEYFLYQLAYHNVALSIGLIIGSVALGGGLVRIRHHIIKQDKWYRYQCPNCGEFDTLKRLKRKRSHRILNVVQIPVKPYMCNRCHWQGNRVDETRI